MKLKKARFEINLKYVISKKYYNFLDIFLKKKFRYFFFILKI